jgi:hypothetical protein
MDRPDIDDKKFAAILKNPDDAEYPWAVSRVLERLRSEDVVFSFFTFHD